MNPLTNMPGAEREDSDEGSIGPPRKNRKYSAEFKLKVIETATAGSNNSASKHYGINRKRIIEWKKSEEEIRRQV
jgi:hypothetical protein